MEYLIEFNDGVYKHHRHRLWIRRIEFPFRDISNHLGTMLGMVTMGKPVTQHWAHFCERGESLQARCLPHSGVRQQSQSPKYHTTSTWVL